MGNIVVEGRLWSPPFYHLPFIIVIYSYPLSSTLLQCAAVAKSIMSTFDAVMLSVLCVLCIPTYKTLLTSNNLARRICTAIDFMRAAAFILACFAVLHSRLDASSPTAGLAFSILRAANLRLVCGPVGSTVAFLNSTPPVSILIVPPASGPRQTKLMTQDVLA
ncbi:hypothetical protein EV421DRAFT_1220994 [Armillaria borealis]|uniref:Uncharacterized protein n=1 Tax=Armillaria borealis TaxID=47425 RepID=A0AA39J3U3_9AGAR|nr:hypothetical protein EV421DRAFT_1220994 [Armillaria borealis]